MSPSTRTSPPSSLPPLHPFQLCGLVELYYTIDLSVGMLMILTRILLLTVHVDCRYTKVLGLRAGHRDLGSPVFGSVHLDSCAPAFIVADALSDVLTEIVVVGVAGPVVGIEVGFEVMSWRSRASLVKGGLGVF